MRRLALNPKKFPRCTYRESDARSRHIQFAKPHRCFDIICVSRYRDDPSVCQRRPWYRRVERLDRVVMVHDINIQCRIRCEWTSWPKLDTSSLVSQFYLMLNLSNDISFSRSPDSYVPWWVRIWIEQFPLLFLVLAVGCFFVALILFAFIRQQVVFDLPLRIYRLEANF